MPKMESCNNSKNYWQCREDEWKSQKNAYRLFVLYAFRDKQMMYMSVVRLHRVSAAKQSSEEGENELGYRELKDKNYIEYGYLGVWKQKFYRKWGE